MKTNYFNTRVVKTYTFLFLTIISCSQKQEIEQELEKANISGTYAGIAALEEQYSFNGEMIFDTNFISYDTLIVTEIDRDSVHYHFDLISGFKTPYTDTPLEPTEYYLSDDFEVWEGLDEYGYTYDYKKHWKFDPDQDTLYFYLAKYPYAATMVEDPDSMYHYNEIWHTWTYTFRAERD